MNSIKTNSKINREKPIIFVLDYFRGYYLDNSFEEFISFFVKQVVNSPWNSDDFLYCLKKVIDNPPENLVEQLFQCGVMFWHDDVHETDWNFKEYLNWLIRLYNLLIKLKETPDFKDYNFSDYC